MAHPTVVYLPPSRNDDVVRVLEALRQEALQRHIVGLFYGALYQRNDFLVDTVGECFHNPVLTRGLIQVLDDRLAVAIGSRPPKRPRR
jgi:hypothetical protein